MAVISLSRQFGAGGKTLGQRLAGRLGYRFVYNDILDLVAEEAQVSLERVSAVDSEYGDRLMRWVENLVPADFVQRHLGENLRDFDEKKYRQFLTQIIWRLAEAGDVVILGRGSQFFLAERADTVRVLMVAREEDRVGFMMRHYDLTKQKAQRLVGKERRRRRRFLEGLQVADPDSPQHYHLVINRSLVSLERAEEMVVQLVEDIGG
jgi:cytidylate kinase